MLSAILYFLVRHYVLLLRFVSLHNALGLPIVSKPDVACLKSTGAILRGRGVTWYCLGLSKPDLWMPNLMKTTWNQNIEETRRGGGIVHPQNLLLIVILNSRRNVPRSICIRWSTSWMTATATCASHLAAMPHLRRERRE